MPQKAKFSLDDPLALPFPPWAPMRATPARQLLDQDGHSPLTSPRRRPICRDIKIQIGKEQFLFGLGAHRFPSLTGSPVCLHSSCCTCCSWSTSPGWRSRGGTDAWSSTVQLILSHKHRQNKVSGCFFFLHILKMVTRNSFHFFCPLCCPCFLNTELSLPGHSKVAVHIAHLEARKGVLLG